MYAIVGAILINAACVLMASGHDSFDIYVGQRILMMVGTAMVAADLVTRARNAIRQAKAP